MQADPLQMNLLFEWISRFERTPDPKLDQRIEALVSEMKKRDLNKEERDILTKVTQRFEEARQTHNQKDPLESLREGTLERVYLKYQGLVFDLKTRFDYISPDVAIQDGLDLSEYVREVIEEIYQDLKESHTWENKGLREFEMGLSELYSHFSRERLRELYPQFANLLKILRDAVKK